MANKLDQPYLSSTAMYQKSKDRKFEYCSRIIFFVMLITYR